LIRVLIADDHPRSRRGLKALLTTSPMIEVVGEATNGLEAIQLIETSRPDAVLLDAQMPVLDGLAAAEQIKRRWPEIKVLILTLSRVSLPDQRLGTVDVVLIKGCPVDKLWTALVGCG
jgi:two-component system nitrate/nitrite response regulator NarL